MTASMWKSHSTKQKPSIFFIGAVDGPVITNLEMKLTISC